MSDKPFDEEAIFKVACQIGSPDARAAYLNQVCGDNPAIFERIATLLRVHDQESCFLESPPLGVGNATTTGQPLLEKPGTQIGPYKLLQQIGEGGMGTVFMAEQTQPVQRKVALKVIKPGMDSHQIIARFEAERQALAMMDHVNIARVLDAGATESGRPYFVMELVHGVPITKYCDDNHLTPRQRLELFVPVCQAIQHAHQKGIIHRDIKPSNVMVTLYDGKPVPKVIDFGVAKATEQKLTERTLFTQYGTMVGTLEYMSPEQAEMSALGVDTRSDIYSLGVLLYELLTGGTPLDRKRVREAAYAEILRMIKEEEPPKPSTRLSDSGEALASISAQRHTEPAKLAKLMRGELDWIVMKTLEKDRNRRYETANGVADDVQRYLNDEPVQACPPSAMYRFRKFARRNRVAFSTAALVLAALVVGTFVSTWQAIRATRAEGLAQTRLEAETEARKQADDAFKQAKTNYDLAEEQRQEAERQRQQAEDARKEAVANLQKAREAVDQMLTRVGEERLANVPQMEPVRKALLEDALKFYQGFLQQKNTDPELRLETGKAWRRVGDIQNHLGQHVHAEKAFQESIVLLEKLAAEFPSEPSYRAALADSYANLGGLLTWTLGRHQEAEKTLHQSLAIREELAFEAPSVPGYQSGVVSIQGDLVNSLLNTARGDAAVAAARQAVALSEKLVADFPTISHYRAQQASSYKLLGGRLEATNRRQEAEQAYRQALAIYEKQMSENPGDQWSRINLCSGQEKLGNLLRDTGRPDEGEKLYRQALALAEKPIVEFPNVPVYRAFRGCIWLQLGILLAATNRPQEAESSYREALATLQKVVADAPTPSYWRGQRSSSQDRLVKLLKDTGRTQEAEQVCRQALTDFEKLVADFPSVSEYRVELSGRHQALGDLLRDTGRPHDAEQAYEQVLQIREKLTVDFPDKPDYWQELADSYQARGDRLRASGQSQEAEQAYHQALTMWQNLFARLPNPRTVQDYVAQAKLYRKLGREDQARTNFEQAMKLAPTDLASQLELFWYLMQQDRVRALDMTTSLVQRFPEAPQAWIATATAHCELGKVDQALEFYRKALAIAPNNLSAWDIGETLGHIVEIQTKRGQFDDAMATAAKAIEAAPKHYRVWYGRGWLHQTQGRNEQAVADYSKAIELAPEQWWIYKRRGSIYFRMDRYDMALADITKAVELRPGDGSSSLTWIPPTLVAACPDKQFQQGMLNLADKAVRLSNDAGSVLAARSRIYVAFGRKDEAFAELQKALQSAPDNSQVRYWHVLFCAENPGIFLQRGLWDQALGDCEKSLKVQSAARQALLGNNLAWVLANSSDPQVRRPGQAVELAKKAVELAPMEGTYWNTLGAAHYRGGDWKAAVVALGKSTELRKGGDGFDWLFLAMAHWQLGDKDQATKYYKQAIEWMDKQVPQNDELGRFRAEAEQLLGIQGKTK